MKTAAAKCELCKATATVHCTADASDLCFACDRRVHSVNFLAARHVRSLISDPSRSLTGPGTAPDEPDASTSASESSISGVDCSSTLERRVLESWGKRMGVRNWRRCADLAARVLISGRVRGFARRAEMAAAIWVGVKVCGSGEAGTCEMMKRLASCSGVSAKIILGIFRKRYLARAVEKRKREIGTEHVMEEGWGEC